VPRLPRAERRAQLLAVAREAFGELGFHEASMELIAERAGVTKPVLYRHFPSKRDLYLALVEHTVDAIVGRVRIALSRTDDNAERVRGAVRAYFDSADDAGFRLVFDNALRSDPEVREVVDRALRGVAADIAQLIARDSGTDPDRAMLLALGLVGMAIEAARWTTEHPHLSGAEAGDLLAALAWRGLRTVAPARTVAVRAASGS